MAKAEKKKTGRSPFQKRKAQKRWLKMLFYGSAGTGKTATSLWLAEYLAKREGKQAAFIENERGAEYYFEDRPEREFHPEAFDVLVDNGEKTSSVFYINELLRDFDTDEFGVLVVDSLTKLWETARDRLGDDISMRDWAKVKRPYKEMVRRLLNLDCHVIVIARESINFGDDDEGRMVSKGYKAKAESETVYEFDVIGQFFPYWDKAAKCHRTQVIIEKDRTSILQDRHILLPTPENTVEKLLDALTGTEHGKVDEAEAVQRHDREVEHEAEMETAKKSKAHLKYFTRKIAAADDLDALKELNAEITKSKAEMTADDITALRDLYLTTQEELEKNQ